MRASSRTRWLIPLFLLACLKSALAQDASPIPARRSVLILHSYHHGFTWSDNISAGIREAFSGHTEDVELLFEFMDTRHISSGPYFDALERLLGIKYADRTIEVIVAADDHALNFMLTRGERLFPGVPLVFCSVTGYQPSMREGRQLTGLQETLAIEETLATALALHPGTREVAVITDLTRTGQALKAKAEAAFAPYRSRVSFRYLEDLTVDGLEEEVAELPPGTIVFLFIFSRDREGRVFSHEQNLHLLARHCRVPIYSVWEFYLGHGIVGGKLCSGRAEGRMVGELALRILNGASASAIPLGRSPTLYLFDHRELERFGISRDRLPDGSTVKFAPFSAYEAYKPLIWGAIAIFAVLLGLVGMLIANILRRRRVQHALRDREEDLRITLDSIGDAVIATDDAGRVTRMNPVAQELTGWPRVEAAGRPLEEIFKILSARTRGPTENPLQRILREGDVVGLANDTLLVARDGTERQIADSGAPIRDPDGKITGVVLVFRDVTERYRLEEQLRHAQKMDSIGQLAGGIAHDFNNMLGGVLGYADLLATRLSDNKKLRSHAENIIDTAERAADLTDKLLAFSRKGQLEIVPVDVHACIRNALAILGRSIDRRITLHTDFQARRTVVNGDSGQLQNAILNLGVNARDAMPRGGTATFRTENAYLDEPACASSPFDVVPGEYVAIHVIDTGIGMTPEVAERIFEPFFTTKGVGEGTGLGLATVYGTVKDHTGCLTVYSEPGRGTAFHLYLPLSQADTMPAAERQEEIVRGTGCILVVDDEETIRNMAVETLQGLGYEVIAAADGEEGLDLYKRHQDRVDAVLLDVVMPRMSGRECFRAIRAVDPAAKVLLSSGFTPDASLEALQDEGVSGFIKKPYRRERLSQVLAEVMGRSDA